MLIYTVLVSVILVDACIYCSENNDWTGEDVPYTISGLPWEYEEEINNYFLSGGNMSNALSYYIQKSVRKQKRNTPYLKSTTNSPGIHLKCAACRAAIYAAMAFRRIGGPESVLEFLIAQGCIVLGFDFDFCKTLIVLNMPIFFYIIDNRVNLTPKAFCGIVAQPNCGEYFEPINWSIYAYEDVPKIYNNKISKRSGKEPIKIAHITDAHIDPLYWPGANAICTKSVCCRADQGFATNTENAAGYWGDYRNCDVPSYTALNVFDQVKKEHPDISAVYYTGDVVAHNIWSTSYEQIEVTMKFVYNNMKDIFGNIAVYPIIGNHETHPVNQFAPLSMSRLDFSTQWLFDYASKLWSPWLTEEATESIKKGGFYSILVKPGFRLLSLNSNVCYVINWWLLLSPIDPYKQLQWLADQLRKAEMNEEAVHILSHIPPGDPECEQIWTREYRKIVIRFSHIIKSQFNGHTHLDEMKVFYDKKDPNLAVNIAWNGGGIVPYSDVNPNYSIFHVDPDTFEILDYDQWIYNLTEANMWGSFRSPRWYKLYSFKETYNVDSLDPKDIHGLIMRMANDNSIIQKYIKYKGKLGDPYLKQICDERCVKNELCSLVTTEFGDNTQCQLFGFV